MGISDEIFVRKTFVKNSRVASKRREIKNIKSEAHLGVFSSTDVR